MPLRRVASLLMVASLPMLAALPVFAPQAGAQCAEQTADFDAAFGGLPDYFSTAVLCPADVGPGFDAPDLFAPFAGIAAAEVTETERLLAVFVGTLRTGSGEDFVGALLQRLGPDAPQGTVTLDGRAVHYLYLPDGTRGYAYGSGLTVVVGYVRAPSGTPSHDIAAAQARQVYTRVLAAAYGVVLPSLPPPPDGIDQWPLARGNYTSPADPGWVFFRTPTEKAGIEPYFCGIAPGGAFAGCDMVPVNAPAGTDQTLMDANGFRYLHGAASFAREVDALRAGERLDNGAAACGSTYQGAVTCRFGDRRFVLTDQGVLE